jgi:hypothetical protein
METIPAGAISTANPAIVQERFIVKSPQLVQAEIKNCASPEVPVNSAGQQQPSPRRSDRRKSFMTKRRY